VIVDGLIELNCGLTAVMVKGSDEVVLPPLDTVTCALPAVANKFDGTVA